MKIEVTLNNDQLKDAIRDYVGKTLDLTRFAVVNVQADSYRHKAEVILKDQAEVDAEAKAERVYQEYVAEQAAKKQPRR